MTRAIAVMMRCGVVAALVLSAAAPLVRAQSSAPAKELVAVLELDALGASKNQVSAVSERMREELLSTGRYRIVDRAQMDKVMEEQALQQTGCTTQECAVQVGRILGVRKLITGKVNRVEQGLWLISCNMVDAESAEIVRAVSFQHEGDFASLLVNGAPQLVSKLTGGVVPAANVTRAPARVADGSLQVANVPPEAEVYVNGASKGNGSQKFTLAPGRYIVQVRRKGFRPWSETVDLKSAQAAQLEPKLERPKLAIFPIRRTGGWAPADNEEHTAGWVTNRLKQAADQAPFQVVYTIHTDNPRAISKVGTDLRKQADVLKEAWSFLGNPQADFAAKKGRELDVDAVLFVAMTTGVTDRTGGWKASLVDVRSGTVQDDSGTWPYGDQAGPGIQQGVSPFLKRYVDSFR